MTPDLKDVPGVGPSHLVSLKKMGVTTVRGLRALARRDGWDRVPVSAATRAYIRWNPRRSLSRSEAKKVASVLRRSVRVTSEGLAVKNVRAHTIGSVRREKARSKDVDLLLFVPRLTTRKRDLRLVLAGAGNEIKEIYASGQRRVSAIVKVTAEGTAYRLRTDFFLAEPAEGPFALLHFTGSWEYNVRLRAHAQRLGLKLNQYGLWRGNRNVGKSLRTERAVVEALGATYLPPAKR